MGLLETLTQDHQEVLALLDRVAEGIRALEGGRDLAEAGGSLEEFVSTWDRAIDNHFRQEEEALFPVLGHVIGTHAGPIAVMLHEHTLLRQAVGRLREALAGGGQDLQGLLEPAKTIVDVLTEHIYKEDRVLFPMAEENLSEEQLAEVDLLAGGQG
ncbi:MAG: hypothetical protein D9V47_08250 [Clostridia bacterium]|nr:MAG: hypothetical protein D9V47_08250 [Clostridia bacterium]